MRATSTLLVASLAFALSGCGWFDRKVTANLTGYANVCVDGVTYLQFSSGVTVKYDAATGKPAACK